MRNKRERIGGDIRTARATLDALMKTAKTEALKAYANGVPEAQIARELSVDRMTIRKWIGK